MNVHFGRIIVWPFSSNIQTRGYLLDCKVVFKGSVEKTCERRGGAHMGFFERIDSQSSTELRVWFRVPSQIDPDSTSAQEYIYIRDDSYVQTTWIKKKKDKK